MPVVENKTGISRLEHLEREEVEPYVPEFELGEDVSQQRHLERERDWASTRTEGREQLSARETNIKYGASLQHAIQAYHFITNQLVQILEQKLTLSLARLVTDFLYHDSGRLITFANMMRNRDQAHLNFLRQGSDTAFQVCVRVRPLFRHERNTGEYQSVFCKPLRKQQITVHEGSLDRSGRRMEMVSHNLMFHSIWDEYCSNQNVSKDIVDPLVNFIESGQDKDATIIMYGQTGTGKTYTLQGIFERLCHLLEGRQIEVTFIEIDGKKSYDLLNNHQRVKLLSDSNDNVHISGAAVHKLTATKPLDKELNRQRQMAAAAAAAVAAGVKNTIEEECDEELLPVDEEADVEASDDSSGSGSLEVCQPNPDTETVANQSDAKSGTCNLGDANHDPAFESLVNSSDFYSTVMRALEQRTQLITERNPVSSRTHAVCQIKLLPPESASSSAVKSSKKARCLTLVDLAGSERKYETMHMSVAEHKRSADINYTLMTLRHIFRTFNAKIANDAAKAAKSQGNAVSASSPSTGRLTYGLPNMSHAGAAELRRLNTKKMTKAREKLRRQADRFVLASHFRGSLLTRILRSCFTGNSETHRTKVIATVSPAATDVVHTLNTLGQVVLMSPYLEHMAMQMEIEVLLATARDLTTMPVEQWGPEEVGVWLRTAEQGRFADVALPPSITGAQLLELSQASLAQLFGREGRVARTKGEGESWVITNLDGTRRDHYSKNGRDWGGAMYKSLMKFKADHEMSLSQSGGSKDTPKSRPVMLKRGSGTGGGLAGHSSTRRADTGGGKSN